MPFSFPLSLHLARPLSCSFLPLHFSPSFPLTLHLPLPLPLSITLLLLMLMLLLLLLLQQLLLLLMAREPDAFEPRG